MKDIIAPPEYGPAMKELTDMQRRFVVAILDQGTMNYANAAAQAGYSAKSPNSLRVCGHNLAHNALIQAAIQEEARKRMGAGVLMAVSELMKIASTASKPSDRLKAIEMILNRAGMHEKTEHKLTVEHVGDDEKKLKDLKVWFQNRGRELAGLVGAKVVDAEYEVVQPALQIASGTDGLEDLLG